MKRGWAMAALALCACSSGAVDAPTPAPAQPAATRPASPPPVSSRDQCGAAEAQYLIGRPRSEIPVPVVPGRQRVACTTCPVTLDFSPQRLNFFFDAQSGIIREVRCG